MEWANSTNSTQQPQTAETVGREQIEQALRGESQPVKPTRTLEMAAKDSVGGTQTSGPLMDNEFPSVVVGSLGSSLLNSPLVVRTAEEYSSIWSITSAAAMQSYVWAETVPDYSFSTIGNDHVAAFISTRLELVADDVNSREIWPGHEAEMSYFDEATWSDQFENKL